MTEEKTSWRHESQAAPSIPEPVTGEDGLDDVLAEFIDSQEVGWVIHYQKSEYDDNTHAAVKYARALYKAVASYRKLQEENENLKDEMNEQLRTFVVDAKELEQAKYDRDGWKAIAESNSTNLNEHNSALQHCREELEEARKGWQAIETAPKDGTHILACNAERPYINGWTFNQRPPTVVHYWENPGEEGFYTSVNEVAPQSPFTATHWQPLPEVPQ